MNPNLKFRSKDPPVPFPSCPAVLGYSGWAAMGFTRCQDSNLHTWDKSACRLRSESKLEKLVLQWVNPKPRFVTKIFSSRSSFGSGLPLVGAEQNMPVNMRCVGWVGNRMCTACKTLAREYFASMSVQRKHMTVTYFAGNIKKKPFGQSPSCLKYTAF